MKKLLLILRSRRGDLLVDGMIGAAVAGIIITATISLLIVLGQSNVANSNNAARSILINSVLSDKLPALSTLTGTPAVASYPVMDGTVEVAVWREKELKSGNPAGTSVLYARTARYGNTTPAQCKTADKTNPGNCLITMMRINDDVGGMNLTTFKLNPGVAPSTYIFRTAAQIPAAVKEVRYVFKVTEASVASTVRFSGDSGSAPVNVTIPSGQTGFYYGSLTMPATATNIYITPVTTGTLTFDNTSFLLYGAPL
jgi:hypothetical protein